MGEFVKSLRSKRNVTQAQLAQSIGQTQSCMSRIESGERQLQFLEVLDICAFLKIHPQDFVVDFCRMTD